MYATIIKSRKPARGRNDGTGGVALAIFGKQGIGQPWDDAIRAAAEGALAKAWIPMIADGDFPVCGKPYRDVSNEETAWLSSIASERHFALNWLLGYLRELRVVGRPVAPLPLRISIELVVLKETG